MQKINSEIYQNNYFNSGHFIINKFNIFVCVWSWGMELRDSHKIVKCFTTDLQHPFCLDCSKDKTKNTKTRKQ
jgi:hypothetical protein